MEATVQQPLVRDARLGRTLRKPLQFGDQFARRLSVGQRGETLRILHCRGAGRCLLCCIRLHDLLRLRTRRCQPQARKPEGRKP